MWEKWEMPGPLRGGGGFFDSHCSCSLNVRTTSHKTAGRVDRLVLGEWAVWRYSCGWCSGSMTLISAVPETPLSSLEWKQATIVSEPLRDARTLTVAWARSYGSMFLAIPNNSLRHRHYIMVNDTNTAHWILFHTCRWVAEELNRCMVAIHVPCPGKTAP